MKTRLIAAALALVIGGLPLAAEAQGIRRGAIDGSQTGGHVAGPVGSVVGGVVGGAVGGAVGGVKGILGIPQDTRYRYRNQRRYHRHDAR